MPLPEAVTAHYRTVQRIQATTLTAAATAWARMGADFDASWPAVGGQLVALMLAAQGAAARSGAAYVPAALAQQGLDAAGDAEVDVTPFTDTAADGRDAAGLLYGAVTQAKVASGAGQAPAQALAAGERWLGMALRTQVSDSARQAASVAITARPRVGWTRMVNPPCCGRCAILAGRFYRYNAGFDRHPGCDCTAVPTAEDVAGDVTTDPQALFDGGHITDLSRADARAIADGADINQVINARRGMATAQVFGQTVKITTEGTTRRGVAYRALREQRRNPIPDVRVPGQRYRRVQVPRLRPESIYQLAEDREDALRLLRLNGYLT